MMTFIILLAIGLAGFFILKRFAGQTFSSFWLMAACSLPLGITAQSAQMVIFNLFLPTQISTWVSFFIWIFFGLYCALSLLEKRDAANQTQKLTDKKILGEIILLALISLLLIVLQSHQLWQMANAGLSVGPPGSYDTLYHLIQVVQIATLKSWHFGSPYFAGDFINYPFLLNLFSGGLMHLGMPLLPAFNWPVFGLTASLVVLIAAFGKSLKLNCWSGFVLLVGALFANNFSYLIKGYPALAELAVRYPLEPISYQSFFFSFLLFQRTFVLGACLFVGAYIAFIKYLNSGSRQALVWTAVLAGLLPLAHTHSFVAFGLALAGSFLAYILNKQSEQALKVLKLILLFCLIALPQVIMLLVLPKFNAGSFPILRLGWLSDPTQAWGIKLSAPGSGRILPWLLLQFWNFGLLLVLPFWLLIIVKSKNGVAAAIGGGALMLWLVPNLVQFQAWDYDNNKFFAYAILLSLAAVLLWLKDLPGHKKIVGTVLISLIVAASLPLSVYRIYELLRFAGGGRVLISDAATQQAAAWLKVNTPDSAIVLSGLNQTPEMPSYLVSDWSGRSNALGFPLWLYTHNIYLDDRLQAVQAFLQDPKPQLLSSSAVPANFLIAGPEVRQNFPELEAQLKNYGYKEAFSNGEFQIYDLNNLRP
jgi:hypothetical protein